MQLHRELYRQGKEIDFMRPNIQTIVGYWIFKKMYKSVQKPWTFFKGNDIVNITEDLLNFCFWIIRTKSKRNKRNEIKRFFILTILFILETFFYVKCTYSMYIL